MNRTLDSNDIGKARIELGAGHIEITGSADGGTHAFLDSDSSTEGEEYLAKTVFEVRGDELVVETPQQGGRRTPGLRLRIETPAPLDLRAGTGSADVHVDVPLGEARISTGSGDIELDRVEGRLDAKTGSGDIQVEAVGGAVSLATGSGDISLRTHDQAAVCSTGSGDVRVNEAVGPLKVKVGSGDITVDRVRNHSVATSGSGDVRFESAEGPSVQAESARGDVHIGVPAGTPTYLDLKTVTGDIRCDLEPSEKPAEGEPSLALRARTVTGDITVVRV